MPVQDLDGDGVQDVLAVHGGDPLSDPARRGTYGRLILFSGRGGRCCAVLHYSLLHCGVQVAAVGRHAGQEGELLPAPAHHGAGRQSGTTAPSHRTTGFLTTARLCCWARAAVGPVAASTRSACSTSTGRTPTVRD